MDVQLELLRLSQIGQDGQRRVPLAVARRLLAQQQYRARVQHVLLLVALLVALTA